jgi:hypothetical protein
MVNVMYGRQIYPTLGGETAADLATGPWGAALSRPTQAEEAARVGAQGHPLAGLVVFGVLVAAIMYLAQHLGEPEEFRNIRASAYNVLLISLIAVAGIPVWKFLFTRVQVPGVSAWVLSV